MNVFLWVLAGVLAAEFLAGGAMKLLRTKEQLAGAGQGWVEQFPPGTIKLIGVLEVAAAIGLVLPPALDIAPVLAPIAAVGLIILMAGEPRMPAAKNGPTSRSTSSWPSSAPSWSGDGSDRTLCDRHRRPEASRNNRCGRQRMNRGK